MHACLPCLAVDSRHVVLCFAVDFAKVDFAKAWLRARACERACVCEKNQQKIDFLKLESIFENSKRSVF